MSGARVDGHDVLAANQALREWAAGLRHWSRAVRHSASVQRERAHAVGGSGSTTLRSDGRRRTAPRAEPGWADAGQGAPSLGQVSLVELHTLLVDLHGFSVVEAARALALGLLVAGYPADHTHVSGVDALEVVEHALRHRL